ncbi:MAG: hypothetical protein IIC82_07000 [Chloroflexi bacterium]|nr:hypothetical protein [Chloroflexota bacterium]
MAQRKFTRVSAKTVDALVEGSIDLHAHFGPDSKIDRSVDLTTLLETATALKMRGVALKSKDYPTQPYAYLGKQQFPDIEPLGALCLDHDVGGMNPDAVKTSGRLGARIVWLPTFSSTMDMGLVGRADMGISCFDREGELTKDTIAVLEQIKRYDMVLATGHISNEETMAVVRKAKDMDMKRIIITHPITAHRGGTPTMDVMKEYASMGCYIEHCLIGLMPRTQAITGEELADAIRELGPQHCIMSSDFGQLWNPPPAYGMKMFIAMMLAQGLTDEEVEVMVKTNPASVSGLD